MEKAEDVTLAKVVFLGGAGVGKTCIVSRAVTSAFDPDQPSTIGGSFTQKDFNVPAGHVSLRIWDTAGQERFRSLAPMYYQNSHCAILVFSVRSTASFQEVEYWVSELRDHYSVLPPIFLVGNMIDCVDDRQVLKEEAWAFAKSIPATYIETSAKTGEGIDELFLSVAEAALRSATGGGVDKASTLVSDANTKRSCC